MRRRTFIAGLGGAAVWPMLLHAQSGSAQVRRVGVLLNNSTNDADTLRHEAIFARTLEALGWRQGQNVVLQHVPPGVNRDSQGAPQERV